jgi:cytochrome bd-type quinol oxidase subunit 2
MKAEEGVDHLTWNSTKTMWTIGLAVAAAAYNALIMWANGGSHYEMLVSGNIKRTSADAYGNSYKMSSHNIAKEYRDWKGFVVGGIIALFTLIAGIIFTVNQSTIDAGLKGGALGVTAIIAIFLCGWALLPFFCYNAQQVALAEIAGTSATTISYLWSCLFALIPIVVSGVFYIAGAYARRNKAVRQQMLADKAAEAEANKVKKINYGGLPGTKPNKKRK